MSWSILFSFCTCINPPKCRWRYVPRIVFLDLVGSKAAGGLVYCWTNKVKWKDGILYFIYILYIYMYTYYTCNCYICRHIYIYIQICLQQLTGLPLPFLGLSIWHTRSLPSISYLQGSRVESHDLQWVQQFLELWTKQVAVENPFADAKQTKASSVQSAESAVCRPAWSYF